MSTSKNQRIIVLTHDVDWPLKGPGKAHVMARQNRFDKKVIQKVLTQDFNPYFGVPTIQETEEKLGCRSTFFFRPIYDNGSEVGEYKQTLRDLSAKGWEVGLHANNTALQEAVNTEKSLVEKAAGHKIFGCRVHCLNLFENTYLNLAQAGFHYDSSMSFNKHEIDIRNTGHLNKNGLVVFPITCMDAYLFTYVGLTEETIVPYIINKVESLFDSGAQILTLLWHDNAVMMKGGRIYPKLIEQLAEVNVTFLTGQEAFKQVQEATQT
jgi:hypothetical protein